ASSQEGTPLTLVGNVTDLNAGAQVSYGWNAFKDGSPFASGSNSNFTFTPDAPGSYVVALEVTDSLGRAAATSAAIQVTAVPPTRATATVNGTQTVLGVPASTPWATPLHLTAGINEPATGETFTFGWSVTRDGRPFSLPAGTVTNGPDFTFTPTANGVYTTTVVITTHGGATSSASATTAVTGAPLTVAITGAPQTSVAGLVIGLSASV